MHQIIYAVVYAKTPQDALDEATSMAFDRLVENGEFDYYTTFNESNTMVSGEDRWGKRDFAVLADSEEGKKIIDETFGYQKQEWMKHFQAVKEAIEAYTPDQLFADKEVKVNGMTRMFKYYCRTLGEYRGSDVFMYDQDGEGITDEEHLHNALTKWTESEWRQKEIAEGKDQYAGLDVYLVPADVHS